MDISRLENTYVRFEYDLLGWLHANKDTSFGRQYNFAAIHSVEDYQARRPPSRLRDF